MWSGLPPVAPEDLGALLEVPGSAGFVFKACYRPTSSHVFVRRLTCGTLSERERADMERARQIDSERVMQVIGIYQTPGYCWLLTEWMQNGSLDALIHQRDLYPLLPLCLCVRVLADSAEGMCHLHGLSPPVAHHALKPSNILLDRQCRAKIADFGYSQPRPLSSATLDNADQECRVLVYQSPERLQGAGPSLQDDVFGFGMTSWETFSRMRPYPGKDIPLKLVTCVASGLRPETGADVLLNTAKSAPAWHRNLEQLLNLCWHRDPHLRPLMTACLSQLRSILRTFPGEEMETCHRSVTTEKLSRPMQVKNPTPKIQPPSSPVHPSHGTPPPGREHRSESLRVASKAPALQSSFSVPPTANQRPGTGESQGSSVGAGLSQPCWRSGQMFPSAGSSVETLVRVRESVLHSMTPGRLNNLLDSLLSRQVISKSEYENIKAGATMTDKARRCLDTCHCKGEMAAHVVLQTLLCNGHISQQSWKSSVVQAMR